MPATNWKDYYWETSTGGNQMCFYLFKMSEPATDVLKFCAEHNTWLAPY